MPRSIQTWIVAVMFITAVSGMSVQTADAGPRTEGAIKGALVGAAVGSLVGGFFRQELVPAGLLPSSSA